MGETMCPLPEVGDDAAADDGARDAHRQRRDRAAGIFAGHDGFRQQADERAEADPDQHQVGDLRARSP